MVLTEKTTLTLKEVKENIKAWNRVRNDPSSIKSFFEGQTHFDFDPIINFFKPDFSLHFYPAITPEGFVLYIIDSTKDNISEYLKDPDTFSENIVESVLIKSPDLYNQIMQEIPAEEAKERIENWTLHNDTYFDEYAPLNKVFAAFDSDPLSIIHEGCLKGFFGLYRTNNTGPWKADIIIKDTGDSYYNTVRPVPPFGQGGGNKFFLLAASIT